MEHDDDLGVDPAFLRVPDLAQLVFVLRFEVEGGHVVEHEGEVTVHFAWVKQAVAIWPR